MAIRPTIIEGMVTKIEIGSVSLALKKDISLEELPNVVERLEYLSQFIDFSKAEEAKPARQGWQKEEVFAFLDDRNQRQITFFEILAEKGEVPITSVVNESGKRLDEPDFKGLTLAGVLGGIGIRTNRMNKEPLYETSWKLDEWHYRLNDKYASFIKEWLKARKS